MYREAQIFHFATATIHDNPSITLGQVTSSNRTTTAKPHHHPALVTPSLHLPIHKQVFLGDYGIAKNMHSLVLLTNVKVCGNQYTRGREH